MIVCLGWGVIGILVVMSKLNCLMSLIYYKQLKDSHCGQKIHFNGGLNNFKMQLYISLVKSLKKFDSSYVVFPGFHFYSLKASNICKNLI